jgi:predicted acetyltransferase
MTNPHTSTFSLDAATAADAGLLGNLLELYSHELSDVFPSVVLGPDGRFGYPQLPLYWSEPSRRFAFLIRVDGQVAGFVLATRGSSAAADPQVLDVAEFFVLRRYRRQGVGQLAARHLWCRLPGFWTVRIAEGNRTALAFWADVLAAVISGEVTESTRLIGSMSWRVYAFDTSALGQAA